MGKVSKTILLTIGIGLLAISIWQIWRISEPSYQGHRLSEWVEAYGEYRYTTNHWAEQSEIEIAIGHMGTKAIPFMLRWIQHVPVSTLPIIQTNQDKPKAIVREMVRAADFVEFRAEGASKAFDILKSNAISALPELARIAGDPHDSDWHNHDPVWGLECPSTPDRRAIFALAGIGPAAMPYLLSLATNRSSDVQCDAVYLLSRMGSNALPAIPLLLKDIQPPTNRVAYIAARALGDLKLSPETVIPTLTNLLEKRIAWNPDSWTNETENQLSFYCYVFSSVAAYGPAARSALPTLLDWLNHDENPFLPEKAADALGKLALEPETVVPALTKALASQNPYLVRSAARALGEFGSSATSAVPALIRVSNSAMRPAPFEAIKALERITNSASAKIAIPF